ncbi:hypothetical protein HUO13_14485 [Saccharopolyspora erythraea]|uniref:hypothetical protein n=1 Tax=Saccharopolyspora erythraea TaxID=1836 RepID=UPI001BAB23A8|nr:hypothetical protein [Saccharopolyspora erythraea]QUH01860.1 hypothetical protein HUO13_14485 [Saccharopolyspora erythraea]
MTVALTGSLDEVQPIAGAPGHGWFPQCAEADSAFEAACGPGSQAVAVNVGSGLWAVKRSSRNGEVQLLCVFNITDSPQSFIPAAHLPTASPQFISGDVDTYRTPEHELVCRLQPFRDVWLKARTGVDSA